MGELGKLWNILPSERPDMSAVEGEILTLDEVAAYLKAGKKSV